MRRIAGIALGLFACLCLAGADRAVAKGKDKKEAQESIELHLLEKNAGASFGDWNVWRYDGDGDKSVFLINSKTGYAVYLPWMSNGWISYRTDKGQWFLLRPKEEPKKEDRSDLKIDSFLKKKPSAVLETGKYSFQAPTKEGDKKVTQQWSVRVTKDYIDFHNPRTDDRITIRRTSGEIVHNGRSIGAD